MLESSNSRQMENGVTYTEQNPPEEGAAIFMSNPLDFELYTSWIWLGSDEHRLWLQRGLIHSTPALAAEKARQMLVLGMEDLFHIQMKRWAHNETRDNASACFALGLASEAGEVANLIKMKLFDGVDVPREKLVNGLGDVLWYLCMLAQSEGIMPPEVEQRNWQKVLQRYPNGVARAAGNREEQP